MISLADLRARNVTPVWQEAVAVVQELIHTVRATTGSAELLPDLEHIALIPNGDVVAIPGSSTPDHPVRHAAIILKLLLEGVAAPPELTTFVERNLAEPPQHDTVAEFSRGLAFFERPGRRSDVERLVSRAMAVEVQRRVDRELELLKQRAAEVARTEEVPRPMQRVGMPGRQGLIIAALLVIAVLGGAALYLILGGGDEDQPARIEAEVAAADAPTPATDAGDGGDAETPVVEPAAAVDAPAPGSAESRGTSLLAEAGKSVSEVVGFAVRTVTGRREVIVRPPSEVTSTPEEQQTASRRPPSSRGSSRTAARDAGRAAGASADAAPLPAPVAPAGGASAPGAHSAATTAPGGAAPDDVAPAMAVVPPAPILIYTPEDAEVVPPVLVRPVLPKEPPKNVPPDQIGTIEVVVDEQGDVASVRLISPANRFHERMLVAAAKMWKFRPAYKDGQPVRYRTRVRLTI